MGADSPANCFARGGHWHLPDFGGGDFGSILYNSIHTIMILLLLLLLLYTYTCLLYYFLIV